MLLSQDVRRGNFTGSVPGMETTTKVCTLRKRRTYGGLLLLCVLTASSIIVIHIYLTDVDALFTSPFTQDDLRSLELTLDAVLNVFNRLNITFFMTTGTLLGSYRHHGRIPWDDDIDLMANSSDKQLIWTSLSALEPDYGLYLHGDDIDSPYHWKVYPRRHGRPVPFKPFRWPFVDLLFFRENTTHIWNDSPWFRDECWPRSAVFPLRLRPFDGFLIPAPCDTQLVLAINFNTTECASPSWIHFHMLPMWSTTVPCAALAHRYPMVIRRSTADNNGLRQKVAESLMLGNRTLHTFILDNGC